MMVWILGCAAFSLTLSLPAVAAPKGELERVSTMVEQMHPGWNLGNSFDATGSEVSWGNPRTTQQLIEEIAGEGFKSIRIPVTWGHRMSGPPDHTIDPAFMERVREVVDWALAAGLHVVINMHHDTGEWIIDMPRDRQGVLARFRSAWTQIADYFKEYPHTLLFEGVNEPRFSHDWSADSPLFFELVDELQTEFHRIVRSSGHQNVTRPILLTTVTGAPTRPRMEALARTIDRLDDRHIVATIHYYGYYPFSVNVAGATRFDERVISDLEQAFDLAHEMFVARGIPVIVGEYGLLGFDRSVETIQRGEMLKFFEYISYYANQKGLSLMLWDNGQHFDRRRGVWRDPSLHGTIMASLSGRASQGETDQLFIKPGAIGDDVQTRLFLRGNTLEEVFVGERPLVRGVDYEIDGEMLIIKGSLLGELLAPEPGFTAELNCRFSHGPDWAIELIVYDTPVLGEHVGTTSAFSIPTQFRGDRLATLEAVYASGGHAGPGGWTSFKEYGYAFWPEYAQSRIRLTREFFNEVDDGEVHLRLHFWSGAVVTYRLVKAGARVTGLPEGP